MNLPLNPFPSFRVNPDHFANQSVIAEAVRVVNSPMNLMFRRHIRLALIYCVCTVVFNAMGLWILWGFMTVAYPLQRTLPLIFADTSEAVVSMELRRWASYWLLTCSIIGFELGSFVDIVYQNQSIPHSGVAHRIRIF